MHVLNASLSPPFIYFIFSTVQPVVVRLGYSCLNRHSTGSLASVWAGSCQDFIPC